MIFAGAIAAVGVTLALALTRALRGPTVFDRILAINSAGTMTVLFICLYGYLTQRPEFLDLALVYALMNFIGMIAVVRYLRGSAQASADAKPRSGGSAS